MMEQVEAYVASDPDPCGLTIADLLAATGASRASSYRAFQPHGGVSEYLQRLRLKAASKDILQTHDPLCDIAKRCGFKTIAHFSHRFRAAYGVSATKYRANARSSQPGS